MTMRLLMLLMVSIALTGLGCEEKCDDETNPECPNYNPCWDARETTAYFTITENTQGHAYLRDHWFSAIDSDTVFQHSLTFTAVGEDADFIWVIGLDTFFYRRSVSLWGFPAGETTDVTLFVERRPNTQCFPNDDGKASLTRSFYRIESFCDASVVGKYRVHDVTKPNHEFEFELKVCTEQGPPYYGSYYIINLDGTGCTKPVHIHLLTNYEFMFDAGTVECGAPIGHIKVNPSNPNRVNMKFAYQRGENAGDTLRLEGVRIRY